MLPWLAALAGCGASQPQGAPRTVVAPVWLAGPAAEPCPVDLPHKVPVEFGEAEFLAVDTVVVFVVCGSARRLELGGRYQLRGTCTLASRARASLVVAVTENDATKGTPTRWASASKGVRRGTDTFALTLALHYEGFPHLTLYDDGGDPFGGFYFGTDQWLLPHKNWSYSRPAPDGSPADAREQSFELL